MLFYKLHTHTHTQTDGLEAGFPLHAYAGYRDTVYALPSECNNPLPQSDRLNPERTKQNDHFVFAECLHQH